MEIWVTQGQNGYYESKPNNDKTPLDLVVHYERTNADYDAFQLYTWGTKGDTYQNFDYDDSYTHEGRSIQYKCYKNVVPIDVVSIKFKKDGKGYDYL